MESPITGKKMTLQNKNTQVIYIMEEISYNHQSYLCESSGHSFTTTEIDKLNMERAKSSYLKKNKNKNKK